MIMGQKLYEFMIHYEIPSLKVNSRIIIEAKSTGVAEEQLGRYLRNKYNQEIVFKITNIQDITDQGFTIRMA